MTRPLATIVQDDTLEVGVNEMIKNAIICLPVVPRSGHLVRILTQCDVVRRAENHLPAARSPFPRGLSAVRLKPHRTNRKVRDITTHSVTFAAAETSLKSIVASMKSHRIEHVSIAEHGTLVGVACRSKLPASSTVRGTPAATTCAAQYAGATSR